MASYDIVIIGGGPGGYPAAIRASQLGMKVAVVEERELLGGTCLNIGCIPSKALLQSTERLVAAKGLAAFGVLADNVRPHLGGVMAHKTQVVSELGAGVAYLFKKNGITWLKGRGRLLSANRVQVAIALVAIRIGAKPADERRTFGYRRFEILAAAFNALLLFGVAIYVLVEGIRRLVTPETVQSTGMLIVAVLGLGINLVSMRLLAGGKDKSLNVKGAYLEVWADMLGSLGVIVGALVIRFTGWPWVDPIVAIAIGLWVLPRTWILLRDSPNILLESTPRGAVLADIRKTMIGTQGVAGVHDLHVWVSGADQASASAHVVLAEGADGEVVRKAVEARLRDIFNLLHVTVQIEREACADGDGYHP